MKLTKAGPERPLGPGGFTLIELIAPKSAGSKLARRLGLWWLLCLAGGAALLLLTEEAQAEEVVGAPRAESVGNDLPLPMKAKDEDGAEFRWLRKPVLNSRLLDSMEDLSTWSFRGEGDMVLSEARATQGGHSLRLRSALSRARVAGSGDWQDLVATRKFPGENWEQYNRLSLWVYPDILGAPAISLSLTLHVEGRHPLPDLDHEGRHQSIPLKNHVWNHVVWEIAPLDRDKVTALDIGYSLPKKIPDPGDQTVLYLDHLELQSVAADQVEGWAIAPGKIAFSHSGYTTGSSKSAIASGLSAHHFSVIKADTGEVALTKPVETKMTPLGNYQILDFSEIQEPGRYLLRAGDTSTRPFRIADDAWRESIWKALNFMYCERCGTEIPGIHGICHQDIYSVHGDKRLVVNGGYHDAGDLSATGHTPAMVYALFSLAESVRRQGDDPVLLSRLLQEAKWGLNWVLKTRFGDGYRSTGQLNSYWTDGIMGDEDDRFGPAVNDPEWNFRVAAVEALAARLLRAAEPELANRSLHTAEEDWNYAVEGLKTAPPLPELYGQKDELERLSFGVIASVELFKATGEALYAREAHRLGDLIVASQERKLQPWSIPLAGYFYSSPERKHLFHRFHVGQEEEPIVALTRLCESFPEDQQWMTWYSAIVLHSQYYLKALAKEDAPYEVLPAGIYRESETNLLSHANKWHPLETADPKRFVEEVRQGVPLGGDYYLRRFPVWFNFRGNTSVLLSEAKALSTAAHLRGDLEGANLAQEQAQWIVGRNPFSASLMYGEGYDWTPLYSVRSGQIVGALPVGIETRDVNDAPYWPAQICYTYKEVWVQPVGEWIWLMQDLHGPAQVQGVANAATAEAVVFQEQSTGHLTTVTPDPVDGTFRALLPQGHYAVHQGSPHTTLTALPDEAYKIDLRADRAFDFTISSEPSGQSQVNLRACIRGAGRHSFTIRTDNLTLDESATKEVELGAGTTHEVVWRAHVSSVETPWVAIIVPDHLLQDRQEATGQASANSVPAGDFPGPAH